MVWDAVLFDMDGTLIEIDMKKFLHDYFSLWQHTAAKYTDEPSEYVKRIIATTDEMVENTNSDLTNEEVFWQFFDSEQFPKEKYMPISDSFYDHEFLQLKGLIKQRPQMQKIVKLLSKKTKLALATNSVFPQKAILCRLKWGGFDPEDFDFIASYEKMHYCKPRPEYFLEIANILGVSPEKCLVVGDDPQLDLVARKLNMTTFFLDIAKGQDAEWAGEAIHVVTEEDRQKGREIADHHGDMDDLEKFILEGLKR